MEPFTTVTKGLQYHAIRSPNKPAFIFRDGNGGRRTLTFDIVYRLGGRWAAVLKAAGLGRGHLVVSALPNSPERVICEAGILLAGAASVNCPCQLADGTDLLRTLRQSQARALVLDPDITASSWSSLRNHLQLTSDNCITSKELPDLQKVFFVQRRENELEGDFLSSLETLEDFFHAEDVMPDDICTVFTTSGSTGFSKLVVFNHDYLSGFYKRIRTVQAVPEPPIDFSISLLGWIGGYAGYVFTTGIPRVLCDVRSGDPKDVASFIMHAFEEEKCNHFLIAPVYVKQMFDCVNGQLGESGIRTGNTLPFWNRTGKAVLLAGQPITRQVVEMATSLFEFVTIIYAATDLGLVSMHTLEDARAYRDYDCGVPVSDVDVRIVSIDDETIPVPPGENGLIQVKHSSFKLRYLNDTDLCQAALTPDGFIRTGDIGMLTTGGHLFVEGRGNDAIMRGVIIFYPGWLETRIRECPGVVDVLVVGVPDPVLNEELCACLVLESDDVTLQSVRDFMENDILTSYDDPLSPRPRHYLKFDAFPSTTTGKPHRKMLKQLATARILRT